MKREIPQGGFTVLIKGPETGRARWILREVFTGGIKHQVSYPNPWLFNLFDVKPLRQVILTLACRIGKIN